MAKIHVIKKFYDLKARVDRLPGETFAADEARARHIESALPGFVEVSADETPKPDGPAKGQENLAKKTVAELTAIARERGIAVPSKPKKAELLTLLKE